MATNSPPNLQSSYERRLSRAWSGSFAVASLLHVLLIIFLATFTLVMDTDPHPQALSSIWTDEDTAPIEIVPLIKVAVENAERQPDAASAARSATSAPRQLIATVQQPATYVLPDADVTTRELSLGRQTTPLVTINVNELARGDGAGSGKPGSFFNAASDAKRIVYVVDCSLSMNHPHPGEGRTRFGVLKRELIRSVASMTDDMEFFIVFFNEYPHPMPARSLRRATSEAKQRYLRWMVSVPNGGQTDPRAALGMALQLNPDLIYFLTDGRFIHKVEQDLQQMSQSRTKIHTIAFGDVDAGPLMRRIASANGGSYRFVP